MLFKYLKFAPGVPIGECAGKMRKSRKSQHQSIGPGLLLNIVHWISI